MPKFAKRLLNLVAAIFVAVSLLPVAAVRAETVREGQWHLDALNISAVQAMSRGDGVVVAVIDSGVEIHPDLVGQVLTGKGFGPAASLSAQEDIDGHGTQMAGLIAAKGGGANNVLGVAPGAKILPLRVSASAHSASSYTDGNTSAGSIIEAIRWAADNGAKVINISLAAGGVATDEEKSAINYALSKDAVIVIGAGNADTGQLGIGQFALVPGVIVVGATDRTGGIWSYSLTGPEVSLTAPGVDIVTTASRAAGSKSGFNIGSGTSNSTAITSAAVALIRSKYPTLKAADVIDRLIKTADDAGSPGRDSQYGYGRLNIQRALTADVPHVDRNPLLGANDVDPAAPAKQNGNTNSSASTEGSSSNPLTIQAILGLLIFAFILLSPIILIIRRHMRRRRTSDVGSNAGYTMPPQNPMYAPAPPASPTGVHPQQNAVPPAPHEQPAAHQPPSEPPRAP